MPRRKTPRGALGEHLDAYREERGWTIRQMCDYLGTSRQVYGGWISGGTTPETDSIFTIAAALGVDDCDVLSWIRPTMSRAMGL